eukprot:741192-Pelagomonas_calceolata.AAC.1
MLGVRTSTPSRGVVSVKSNLFNSTGSELVHAFIVLSPIATALYFTRSRHVAYWRQFSGYDSQDTNRKNCTYHYWRALPTKPAHATYPPYILPNFFYLEIPKHIVRSGLILPSCPFLESRAGQMG